MEDLRMVADSASPLMERPDSPCVAICATLQTFRASPPSATVRSSAPDVVDGGSGTVPASSTNASSSLASTTAVICVGMFATSSSVIVPQTKEAKNGPLSPDS